MALTILRNKVIAETRKPGEVFRKLSDPAKQLASHMSDIYRQTHQKSFSLDDIRQVAAANWRTIQGLFYELESRRLGKVKTDGAVTKFHAFIPALQNLSEETLRNEN